MAFPFLQAITGHAIKTLQFEGELLLITFLAIFALTSLGLGFFLFKNNKKLSQANKLIDQYKTENIKLEAELNHTKERASDSFKLLAQEALENNSQQFINLAKSIVEQESKLAQSDLEKRQLSIESTLKPFKETLDRYQKQTQEMERERQRSYNQVENELKKVVETSQFLSQETSALKNALKKPHIRGRWGEVQLKNCVELAGMSEYSDVSFQDSLTDNDNNRLIPDMTVNMPGNRVVIVDAKTPLDAFISSLEATTDELKNAELIRHGKHIKDHIKKLSAKDYAEAFSNSADFTVMFLPNESFLYAALETQPDLVEYALEKKVLIATPPTFIGLLKVIRFGWNEEKLAENAQLISETGKELHKRVCDFVEAYVGIGKSLEKAQNEYQTGLTRLKSRVLTQAEKLEKLGAKGKKNLLIKSQEGIPETLESDSNINKHESLTT